MRADQVLVLRDIQPQPRLKIGPAVTETQEPYALAPDLKDPLTSAGVLSTRRVLELLGC